MIVRRPDGSVGEMTERERREIAARMHEAFLRAHAYEGGDPKAKFVAHEDSPTVVSIRP